MIGWPTMLSRIRPSIGNAHCTCFCRVLTTHSGVIHVPQRRFEKGRKKSFSSTGQHDRPRKLYEIDSSSFRNRNTDNLRGSAEQRQMSAEFSAMRREELCRFPKSSTKLKTTNLIEQKSATMKYAVESRASSSKGLMRRDKKERFLGTSSSRVINSTSVESATVAGKRTLGRQRSFVQSTQHTIPK